MYLYSRELDFAESGHFKKSVCSWVNHFIYFRLIYHHSQEFLKLCMFPNSLIKEYFIMKLFLFCDTGREARHQLSRL